jgi:hypothetical protein
MINLHEGDTLTTSNATEWIDVEVSEIRRTQDEDPTRRKHIMTLAERNGDRWLPMWIGPAEATALALTLSSAENPRPFTYKLAASLVAAAGASVTEVRITQLIPPVFYASVLVSGPAGLQEVDSRPSDAVNLALAAGAPIRVDDQLFATTPPDHQEEVLAISVATADIAAEFHESIRAALEEDR